MKEFVEPIKKNKKEKSSSGKKLIRQSNGQELKLHVQRASLEGHDDVQCLGLLTGATI